jgi:hypothetical protein
MAPTNNEIIKQVLIDGTGADLSIFRQGPFLKRVAFIGLRSGKREINPPYLSCWHNQCK